MRRPDAPLTVEIPAPLGDRPAWGKVGIVAACGFVLGIAWPRLTSTRIAPHPPGEGPSSSVAAAVIPSSTPPAATSAETVGVAPKAPVAAPGESRVAVGHGTILRCHDQGEEPAEDCGSLEFDPVAVPRIKALAQCPGASAATGKLSIGFDVDFRRKEVRVLSGKSTTLPKEKADALVKCADTAFDKVSLAEVPHKHRRYLVFYTASFAGADKAAEPVAEKAPAEGPAAGTTTSESPASGLATVVWDVVLVRDAPKTGTVVGRIMRGSRVKVMAHQGEWYRVVFGATDGWVYRGTIGL
ncbi:MAG TPA: SH3 domain-containing protein [Polyangiaceae bacterium]|nr:SH3 domain-containing protein [Polyangiaceae bacterium]